MFVGDSWVIRLLCLLYRYLVVCVWLLMLLFLICLIVWFWRLYLYCVIILLLCGLGFVMVLMWLVLLNVYEIVIVLDGFNLFGVEWVFVVMVSVNWELYVYVMVWFVGSFRRVKWYLFVLVWYIYVCCVRVVGFVVGL